MKISINNKMKGGLGQINLDRKGKVTGKKGLRIQVNVKAHKGDRAELASTIKHELTHAKYPKMTEKQVYKRTAKSKISPAEQNKLIAKLRHKKLNYQTGAIKRKLKINQSESLAPGALISKAKPLTKRQVAIRGLI